MKKRFLSPYNRRRLACIYNRAAQRMRFGKRKQFVVWDIIWEPPQTTATTIPDANETYAIKNNIVANSF